MRRRRTTAVGALCALTGALAMTATAAQAADSYRDRSRHSDRYQHQRYDPNYAGSLIIDGCAFDLSTRRPLGGQIVAQVSRRGYRVWCEGGKIFIRWRSCRPRVQWRNGCYRVNIQYAGDCIILCPVETSGGRYGREYDRSNTRYDSRYKSRYDSRRDDRGDYRGGSYRSRSTYDRGTNMPYPRRSGWSSSKCLPYQPYGRTYRSWPSRTCESGWRWRD